MISKKRPMAFVVIAITFLLIPGFFASSGAAAHSKGVSMNDDNKLQPFTLFSPDFHDSGPLPASSEYGGGFGCTGQDIAPLLEWKNVPSQTRSFALVLNDVDAAVAGGFHHWIVYNIPAPVRKLHSNTPYTEGTNSLSTQTYFGPCPPPTGQKHHYIFTLYALSVDQIPADALTYDGLIQSINGQVIEATTIVGTFRRVPPGIAAN